MKYIFRDRVILQYHPENKCDKVELVNHGMIKEWDLCSLISLDYKLLSQFFDTVYRHTQGEDVELKDIEVY